MANSRIKEEAKATPEQVVEVLKTAAGTQSVIPQKIYVGPNLLGLPTYTVVETEFTPHIESFIKECPEIEKLFVPIAEMANTEQRAKVKGTLEHRYYQKVTTFKNDGRKDEQ